MIASLNSQTYEQSAPSHSKLIPSSISEPCQICGSTDGRCKHGDQGELCMTLHAGSISGFKRGGACKGNSSWTLWVPDRQDTQASSHDRTLYLELAQKKERDRLAKLAKGLKPHDRHTLYSEILNQLRISPDDRAMMVRRGMSGAQIERFGGRSVEAYQAISKYITPALPGVTSSGRSFANAAAGFLCPVRNVRGQIVAFQIRLRTDAASKYRWLSGVASAHMPIGENPLGVCIPPVIHEAGVVGLCEGIGFKPFLAADRLGLPMIGAAGGQFTSSPKILLGSLRELDAKQILFFPDAGAIENHNVLSQYFATFNLLLDEGYEVQVGWWGQESKEGGDPQMRSDIDEIKTLEKIGFISLDDFWKISKRRAMKIFREACDRLGEDRLPESSPVGILRQAWEMHREADKYYKIINLVETLRVNGFSMDEPAIVQWMQDKGLEDMTEVRDIDLKYFENLILDIVS